MRISTLVLLVIAVGAGFCGGCYHTRSLGFTAGDEALVEQEVLGRTTRYLLDVDQDTDPARICMRLLEVEGITERMRAAHERVERIRITQTWPLPLGWFVDGETAHQTRETEGLIYQAWSDPYERFDVIPVPGQAFEIVIDAESSRQATAGVDGWAGLPRPETPSPRILIRTDTPSGRLEKPLDLR